MDVCLVVKLATITSHWSAHLKINIFHPYTRAVSGFIELVIPLSSELIHFLVCFTIEAGKTKGKTNYSQIFLRVVEFSLISYILILFDYSWILSFLVELIKVFTYIKPVSWLALRFRPLCHFQQHIHKLLKLTDLSFLILSSPYESFLHNPR